MHAKSLLFKLYSNLKYVSHISGIIEIVIINAMVKLSKE